ncbi:MAG: hypothetical protein WCA89_10985 [Terracidiphilus sp.]|jgi:hypothetical protein
MKSRLALWGQTGMFHLYHSGNLNASGKAANGISLRPKGHLWELKREMVPQDQKVAQRERTSFQRSIKTGQAPIASSQSKKWQAQIVPALGGGMMCPTAIRRRAENQKVNRDPNWN